MSISIVHIQNGVMIDARYLCGSWASCILQQETKKSAFEQINKNNSDKGLSQPAMLLVD